MKPLKEICIPSPNPKQGIKLSSSNAAKVFPIMDIACS
jgi:hypothetical protein